MKIYFIFIALIILPHFVLSQIQSLKKPSEKIYFEHITEDQGLSDNNVTCILQDSKGFMWFGTTSGLNKFDGYNFTIYKNDPDKENSLIANYITSMFEDIYGNIWIGSKEKSNTGRVRGGLNKYDRKNDNFKRYHHVSKDSTSISSNYITSITQKDSNSLWVGTKNGLNQYDYKNNNFKRFIFKEIKKDIVLDQRISSLFCWNWRNNSEIWIGTNGRGLMQFDIKTKKFKALNSKTYSRYSNFLNFIQILFQDNLGTVWIGTEYGLFNYDRETDNFIRYISKKNDFYSLSENRIRSIYEDNNANIWVGTLKGGLNKLDRKTGRFINYKHDPKDPSSISDNKIRSIFQDRSGVMWVGTSKGINKFGKADLSYVHHKKNKKNGLKYNSIWDIIEDSNGYIWIGTSFGIKKYDKENEKFLEISNPILGSKNRIWSIKQYEKDIIWFGTKLGLIKHTISTNKFFKYVLERTKTSNYVKTIFQDKLGTLWLGTIDGLVKYDVKTNNYNYYRYDRNNQYSISRNSILTISELKIEGKDCLLIGTQLGGLNIFDRQKNIFHRYTHNKNDSTSISDNTVWIIYQDSFNEIWLVSRNGLNRFLQKTKSFKRYQFNNNEKLKDVCKSIVEDDSGNLWVGNNSGLFKYNREKDEFLNCREKFDLKHNRVDAIVEDNDGNLWLSSDNLVTKFNPKTNKSYYFKIAEGINNTKRILHPNVKTSDGKIIFSGLNGFVIFDPKKVKRNLNKPEISLTDLKIFNKSVKIRNNDSNSDREILLDRHISECKEIKIPYDKDVFSIEFSALDFREPSKNKYAYKLDGIDPDWVYTDASRRFATYNQLNPGEYTFYVKGSNNDGVWNEEGKSLKIIITPLWWQTIWFKIFVAGFLIGIILLIFYNRINALRKKHELQEEFTRQLINSQEMDRKRIASALHDSHGQNLLVINNEVQTFVNDHDQYKEELKPVSEIIHDSINEIRNISYDLHPHQLDKLGFVKTIRAMIKKIGSSSKTKFSLNIDNVDEIMDKKIEINLYRIIQEAINNIIKHSQATESHISIKNYDGYIQIQIYDNGRGFNKSKTIENSNGLGLTGMQERAYLIKAELEIETDINAGTKIKLSIPIN